jgi:integrase
MPPIGDVARVVDRLLQRDPFFGTLLRLAVMTGARRGELCALRWEDLDLARMFLMIAGSISDGAEGLVIKQPKTNRSRRVPLDPGTVEALKALRDRCGVPKSDAFVFSQALDGMTPMHPSAVTHRWIKEAKAAGLKGVRLHDLRHLMVTTLLDAGVPLAVVSQRAGHSSKTVTLNTYAHAVQDSERAAADVMAGRMRTLTGQPVPLPRSRPIRQKLGHRLSVACSDIAEALDMAQAMMA